ncbi:MULTISPECIES: NADH-quinone oxidoreductase subunit C [unclassified Pseudactinotalea]|uniref:NADH-quinone oxidoreductase subunit C n=1 Tax=Micrococcales TaxID=85006 RepID=UPI003C7ABB8C
MSDSTEAGKPDSDSTEAGTPDSGTTGAGTEATRHVAHEAQEAGAQQVVQPEGRTPLDVIKVREGLFGVTGSGDTSGFGRLVRPVFMPGPTERPYGSYFDEIVDILTEVLAEAGVDFDDAIEKVVVFRAELTLYTRREYLHLVARSLRDDQDLRFEICHGVSGVHYPEDTGRELHAVYPLYSITHNRTMRLEVAVADADPHIPSLTAIYPANDWHEREAWDLLGIIFDGHPGLSRIQMPDDWPGHPQRKDYPLGGIEVEYKGATIPAPDERRAYN